MKIKIELLKDRLSNTFELKEIKVLLAFNSFIAVLLTIFSFTSQIDVLLLRFGYNFIIAQCVGGSIYFFSRTFQIEKIKSKWKKLIVLTGLFVLAGWAGFFLGRGINTLLFNFSLGFTYAKNTIIWITFFAIFFGTIGYSYFVLRGKLQEMIAKLAEKEVNEQRLLRLKTLAELNALRAKVNPHFLFNTLNSIASLIPVDPGKAEAMVQKLSRLFRYNLDASGLEMIKLKDELEVTEEYLDIEKVRLGNRLNYQIKMEESLSDFLIPGFIIQPLVENSIKHGIAPLKSGGHINIHCTKNADTCQIEISDNGTGFTANENGNGFGLGGVKERLVLYYGDNYEFDISNEAGVRIRMRLPLAVTDTKKLGKDIIQ